MKVKVGNTWYDSETIPICIQISEREQEHISKLDRSLTKQGKYASFPDGWGTSEEMRAWMNRD